MEKFLIIEKGSLIGTSFLMNILNFSILNVRTIRYNLIMHDIEKRAGVGLDVVGKLPQGTILDNDPVSIILY